METTTTLERKLRLLVDLGYYPFWHTGATCDGDDVSAGWVVSREAVSCRTRDGRGLSFGSPRHGAAHQPTLEQAADVALRLLADQATSAEEAAAQEQHEAHARREAIASVAPYLC